MYARSDDLHEAYQLSNKELSEALTTALRDYEPGVTSPDHLAALATAAASRLFLARPEL